MALAVAFGLAMFVGLYWVIWLTGPYWWLVAAAAFFAVSILLGQLAPVLIMPLFYKIEKLNMPELTDRLARLSEGTGLSIEGVYRMGLSEETSKANAMLAGMGRTRRVLLGDTLINNFSLDEIEVIFAHEIGHHVFHHIRKLVLAGLVYSAVWFWICDLILRVWVASRRNCFRLRSTARLHAAAGDADRHRTFQPDRAAAKRHLAPLRTAMRPLRPRPNRTVRGLRPRHSKKLAKLNKDDPDPPRLEVLLFHSHPPIGDRLAMAKKTVTALLNGVLQAIPSVV